MALKHLEHDGGEDFSHNVKNRVQLNKESVELEFDEEEEKAKKQEQWLDPRNEFLWTNEF